VAITVYFENGKTKKRFKVLKIDKAANTIMLQGEYGTFSEPYNKERFQKMGYKLVQVDGDAPAADADD
jgi:hypothetical protein